MSLLCAPAATLLSRGYVVAMSAAVLEHTLERHFLPQLMTSGAAQVSS